MSSQTIFDTAKIMLLGAITSKFLKVLTNFSTTVPPQPQHDPYSIYEQAITTLLDQILMSDAHAETVYVFCDRLRHNILCCRWYGETNGRLAERTEIVAQIHRLTMQRLEISFYKLLWADLYNPNIDSS